jgi:molybdopterin converting factor small subunit
MAAIAIELFGEVKRLLPQPLSISVELPCTVMAVIASLEKEFPQASGALHSCAVAREADIVSRDTVLSAPCTLVLLSPVSGG